MPRKHRLQSLRSAASLTQVQLGKEAGVRPSTISHIECHRGKDVPMSEPRKTKTRLRTAVKLSTALNQLPPGTYSLDEFIGLQTLFPEGELYEAARRDRKTRNRSRRPSVRRESHLRLVS